MATFYQLDFESPVIEIERRIQQVEERIELADRPSSQVEVRPHPFGGGIEAAVLAGGSGEASRDDLETQLAELREMRLRKLTEVYSNLSPWETVRVARHPSRPQTRDYVSLMCKDFYELHGDRRFGDDPAIVTGFARLGAIKCLIVGHQKGRTTPEKLSCHFGCAHPEGYRKALAKMKMAEKFGLPIVTLVDTPGAYPGIGAEERGQAEAIAVNMMEMSRLEVPIVSVIIGEGGSGGALGIAVADRVAMLEHSWYSVISPEGCAAILWKQANEQTNAAAAQSLRLTSKDNLELGIIDEIIPEPTGGAHRNPTTTATSLEAWLVTTLQQLKREKPKSLVEKRYARFRRMGAYLESAGEPDDSTNGQSAEDPDTLNS